MRVALLALATVTGACTVQGNQCLLDKECSTDEVCTRDHSCVLASSVRSVKATWTINGADPTDANCPPGEMYISFTSNSPEDSLGFRPLPCVAGQFSVDKLPVWFDRVEVGFEGGARDFAMIDDTGMAALDLQL
ncbi:MAG TPA: hypothetical protein VFQ53_01560 [Kofleriaceae bacterium]|nr:hypothetical protein [Kofleriaceae bacterium]